MKKYLLGIFAIALAVGFSAFTNANTKSTKKFVDSYWFLITGSDAVGNAIPASDAQFIQVNGSTPTDASCGGSGKYCITSFSVGQVTKVSDNPLVYVLKDDNQLPVTHPSDKN